MKLIVKKPVVTEKSSNSIEDEKYTFLVASDANKIEVRKYIENQYDVKVKSVNIVKLPSKKRVRGRIIGHTASKKKAIITLEKGENNSRLKDLF